MDLTNNLSDFGCLERLQLIKILEAWNNHGLPDDFTTDDVKAVCDLNFGDVYLENNDLQRVASTDAGKLEIYYVCDECGHKGFKEDCELNDYGCNECAPLNFRR